MSLKQVNGNVHGHVQQYGKNEPYQIEMMDIKGAKVFHKVNLKEEIFTIPGNGFRFRTIPYPL